MSKRTKYTTEGTSKILMEYKSGTYVFLTGCYSLFLPVRYLVFSLSPGFVKNLVPL